MELWCVLAMYGCCFIWNAASKGIPHHHPPGLRDSRPAKVLRDWKKMGRDDIKRAMETQQLVGQARNVIMFLGDGMGPSTVTAARQLLAQTTDTELPDASLEWDKFYNVGLSKTYNIDRTTPDSAATGTAFLCGQKAMYSTIGVNQYAYYDNCTSVPDNKVDSILKRAIRDKGWWGGVVTQTRVTHATPAAAYAHVANRNWEATIPTDVEGHELCTDIAYQLVMDPSNQDIRVVLGGGRRSFLNASHQDPLTGQPGYRVDGNDLLEEWKSRRAAELGEDEYLLAYTKEEFDNADPEKLQYLMGLFNYSEMDYEWDRNLHDNNPSLSAMTRKAIEVLDNNENGYFLLVEGGRIDQAHHDNSAFLALHDTLEFNEAVKEAMELTDEEDTLIIVTADHSHAFTMGGYPSIDNDVFGLDNSVWPTMDNKPYTGLGYTNGPAFLVHRTEEGNISNVVPRLDLTDVDTTDRDFVQDVAIPLDYETHDGEDVGIYAHGPMAHLIHGVHEQSYIAHVMMYAACILEEEEDTPAHCSGDVNGATGLICGQWTVWLVTIVVFRQMLS